MNVTLLLFEGLTALDAVGPYQVLSRMPGVDLRFVAPAAGLLRTDDRLLCLQVDSALEEVERADVLVVPGGFGTRTLMADERVLAWLRAIDQTTRITASVCTGSLLLAAAGLLRGRRANTHWAVRSSLRDFGAIPCGDRYVRDGKYATAAGVSAGIDLALALVIELAGPDVAQSIQLQLEYDPQPPLDAGNAERAPAELRERLQRAVRARERELREAMVARASNP
jgi:transcriptional regulator GlxA family with amidase domain